MKRLIHTIGDLKFLVGIYFMSLMIFATVGSFFLHGETSFDIITIWQIFGMSLVFGLLHFIQTSKLQTALRITLHAALSYLNVIVFSLLCGWGFTQDASVFWQFTISFIAVYVVIFLLFIFYYKNEETYLNKRLDEYKQNT